MNKELQEPFFKHVKGDLLGGLTAGIVALPLALAFGVQSGLGAVAGLYGAIFIGFFASLFGGTNTQISGPTAPMTAVSMVIIAGILQLHNGNLELALPSILIVFMLAGLFQILLGILKLGRYIKYIPYPVVSGFMTGIGVIILITQLLPAMGYYPRDDQAFVQKFIPLAQERLLQDIFKDEVNKDVLVLDDFEQTVRRAKEIAPEEVLLKAKTLAKSDTSGVLGALKTVPTAIQKINILELALAMATILIIFGFKRLTTIIPSTLVALLLLTGIVSVFHIDVRSIGEIPSVFPVPHLDVFTQFNLVTITPYVFTALTLALVGAIDSLLTSVVADNMTKTSHEPNKELVGQGIGNSVSALFGGIPGAGATIRTVVNIQSGGKTRLSGMIAAVALLFIVLVLGPYASQIPSAVLAGILITVGIGVMDFKGMKAIKAIPKSDVFIMIVVLLLTVFWDLVYAVGIGLVIASLSFMKKMGDLSTIGSSLVRLSSDTKQQFADYSKIPMNLRDEIYIKELTGPLFFGYTGDFVTMTRNMPDQATHAIIRMEKVPFVDQSGLFAVENVMQALLAKNIQPLLVGIDKQPRYRMEAIDIIPGLIQEEFVFETYEECLTWVLVNVKDTVSPVL